WLRTTFCLALVGAKWVRRPDPLSPRVALRYVAGPAFALLVALLDRQRIRSARDLRIACFIIPLPFGTAFFREARTRPLAAFAVGAILGVVATCAMTISVSLRYLQYILPSDTFETQENGRYVISIC